MGYKTEASALAGPPFDVCGFGRRGGSHVNGYGNRKLCPTCIRIRLKSSYPNPFPNPITKSNLIYVVTRVSGAERIGVGGGRRSGGSEGPSRRGA